MARGVILSALVSKLRAEVGMSTNSAVGQEKLAQLQQLLRRHQETLYEKDWHFLRNKKADKAVVAGSRYYDFPTTINPDRIDKVLFQWGSQWIPVAYGIDTEREYNVRDSDAGERSDPVERWDWHDDGGQLQFEVWPMPASAGTLRFVGKKALSPLIADTDAADLDDILIVLFAAAELRQGEEDAKIKETFASDRLRKLLGNSSKKGPTVIGSDMPRQSRAPVTIRISGA